MKRIGILLVEDHTLVREGLRRILASEPDLHIVGEAPNGRVGVEMALRLRPDVILMDVAMPLLNGLDATRQVLKALPRTRVFMLSAYNDEAYIASAKAAGAVGFLLKQSTALELGQALRDLRDGAFFCPSSRRSGGAPSREAPATRTGTTRQLTSRQREVLQLIAEGKANKEVAAELGIGIKTAEKHREHLMKKLDIHDTAGLTRYAIAAGIIESVVRVKIR